MRPIEDSNLAELLMQMRYMPPEKRRRQLEAVESLVGILEADKSYPFEFVHFRITGFQVKHEVAPYLIPGDQLLDDLRIFVTKLSSQASPSVEEMSSRVFTVEELARQLGVSTKTVGRWRKRGLVARRFVFPDGVKRLGVLESSLKTFQDRNTSLISNAKQFNRLSESQKQAVIDQARGLAEGDLSRYQVIERLVELTGRAHETIRYTLLHYEQTHPQTPVFKCAPGVMTPSEAARLYELYQQGVSAAELMTQFERSRSSVYRIINQRRTMALMARRIRFVPSDEFADPARVREILDENLCEDVKIPDKTFEPFEPLGEQLLPEYLQVLKGTPVLSGDRELLLFRQYNCHKYMAYTLRSRIKLSAVSGTVLKQAESYLSKADDLERLIVEANLRLVVSIASRHSMGASNFADMVSKGNYALIKAVQGFDYTTGFRFGKRASLAIAKEYAKVSGKSTELTRTKAASIGTIQQRLRETVDIGAIERARHSLTQVIRSELENREQYIILHHFGLIGHSVRKQRKTLNQIGLDLKLSTERVRQLELTALQKLRQCLSREEFELLTE